MHVIPYARPHRSASGETNDVAIPETATNAFAAPTITE
jgi:hypothetical protein